MHSLKRASRVTTGKGENMVEASGFSTTQDIIRRHRGHYFDPSTMRFFRSRVLWQVFCGKDEVYFVTSERFVGSDGYGKPRYYTVRAYNPETDDIHTFPPFIELQRS